MEHKDYYKIMGLQSNASDKEIKLAYRRLARKYHPDLNKDKQAEEKFKALGEANEVLKDPEKRREYDQYCRDRDAFSQRGARQENRQWRGTTAQDASSFSNDFFESLFKRGQFHESVPVSADMHAALAVSLEDTYHGAVREIQLPSVDATSKAQALRVKIPAGIKSGQQIRLTGQGGVGPHGRGDLYITIQVDPHPIFDVMENDIYVTLPVTPWEVALGETVKVPTLGGLVDLKIPGGSESGQKLRLKKRGLSGKVTGDQYVVLKVVTPKAVTDKDRGLYQKMAQEMPLNPRKSMGG